MKKIVLALLMAILFVGNTRAQVAERAVALNSFWDNWYVQVGLDMSLQNPHGYDFAKVFPDGKSFGVDVAVGKQFTPEVSTRAKINWENGIGLFENHHAVLIAPLGKENIGKNMDKGGYMSVVGDFVLDIHNIVYGYDTNRKWNMYFFPRAGLVYNFGVEKGSPLIGLGIGSTWKLKNNQNIYFDIAYQGVSSGFTGCEGNTGTGTGANSNGYFDINVGYQFNLGKSMFKKIK